jgi:hypothetical protein
MPSEVIAAGLAAIERGVDEAMAEAFGGLKAKPSRGELVKYIPLAIVARCANCQRTIADVGGTWRDHFILELRIPGCPCTQGGNHA